MLTTVLVEPQSLKSFSDPMAIVFSLLSTDTPVIFTCLLPEPDLIAAFALLSVIVFPELLAPKHSSYTFAESSAMKRLLEILFEESQAY